MCSLANQRSRRTKKEQKKTKVYTRNKYTYTQKDPRCQEEKKRKDPFSVSILSWIIINIMSSNPRVPPSRRSASIKVLLRVKKETQKRKQVYASSSNGCSGSTVCALCSVDQLLSIKASTWSKSTEKDNDGGKDCADDH